MAEDPLALLDEWEKKECKPLLDTRAWRQWRDRVCNPKTTADDLERCARPLNFRKGTNAVWEAIVAHPNAPTRLLRELLTIRPYMARALCRNPVAPLLLMEEPGFVAALSEGAQFCLLQYANAPPAMVELLANGAAAKNLDVQNAARLHIAVAGEFSTPNGWIDAIRSYWRDECLRAGGDARQWHRELVELGLAPEWAMGNPPFPAPLLPATFPTLDAWFAAAPTIVPDLPEETALLKNIGPSMKELAVLARGLRLTATPDDLIALLDAPKSQHDLVRPAILRHPAANADVFAAFLEILKKENRSFAQQLVVFHEHTPPDVLESIASNDNLLWRRLACQHKNATPAVRETAARVSRTQIVQDKYTGKYRFASFVGSLHFGHLRPASDLVDYADSMGWTHRLEAVLIAGQNPSVLKYDVLQRTREELLSHLTRDGNRIVRAAAATYLSNPNYRFTL